MRAQKIIRRTAWILIALATLVALFYAEEDWRGARAWQSVLQQMRDAGEPMTLRELIPPGAPQADLSKTAMFANENPEVGKIRIPSALGNLPKLASIAPLREIDLTAWQHYFRSVPGNHLPTKQGAPAADILETVSQFDPLFAKLDQALSIPDGYFPLNYDMSFGSWLQSSTSLLNVAKILQLRGLAHLENSQGEEAKNDFLLCLRMEEPTRHRLFLIDLLIREANQMSTLPILWKGMQQHAWTNADLAQMEKALMDHDFLSELQSSLRGERLGSFQVMAILSSKAGISKNQDDNPGVRLFDRAFVIWPSGWIYQDWAAIGRMDARAIADIHPKEGTIDRDAIPSSSADWLLSHLEIYRSELAPVIRSGVTKAAQAESYRRMACIACELERYYLVHHAYPDQLSALTDLPPILGREVLNQQPFHYRNLGATYQLYSTGWNETDEGPRIAFKKDDSSAHQVDETQGGDWPWPGP